MIALVVGALATVVVSWAFALRPIATMELELRRPGWAIAPAPGWPDRPDTGYDAFGAGVAHGRWWIHGIRIERNEPVTYHQIVWATGWPWPALCCEHRSVPGDDQRWLDPATRGLPPADGWRYAWIIDASALQRAMWAIPGLPLRPVWPGFALCSLCYGAIAWLPLAVLAIVRLRWRRRRGACLRCGYLLAPDCERCPECGAPPTPSSASSASHSAADDRA